MLSPVQRVQRDLATNDNKPKRHADVTRRHNDMPKRRRRSASTGWQKPLEHAQKSVQETEGLLEQAGLPQSAAKQIVAACMKQTNKRLSLEVYSRHEYTPGSWG